MDKKAAALRAEESSSLAPTVREAPQVFTDEEYILAKAALLEVLQIGSDRARLDAAKYVIERRFPTNAVANNVIHVDSINVLLAQAREKISAAATASPLLASPAGGNGNGNGDINVEE